MLHGRVEIEKQGRNTHTRVGKFPTSDGHMACQNLTTPTMAERDRFDLESVTFSPSEIINQ
jgi:hypothetical protein